MPITRRQAVQALALSTAAVHLPGWTQNVTKVLVGFPPSGLPDMVARAMAEAMGRAGAPAVVENRIGANGRLAAQAVKAAAPDGRTLLITPASGMVHLPHVYKNLGYDPFTDFVPVAQLVENDFAFTISPRIPARTVAEFAAWAKANPDAATYASPGLGSAPHLMGATLSKALGVPLRHVPYKGNSFALNDMAGGHISSMFSTTSFVSGPHKAGTARILAVTGPRRHAALPEVPTFGELGIGQLAITEGIWLFAPAKTPAAVVEKIAASAVAAANTPEMKSAIQDQATVATLTPVALAPRLRGEFERRGEVVRSLGFTANE